MLQFQLFGWVGADKIRREAKGTGYAIVMLNGIIGLWEIYTTQGVHQGLESGEKVGEEHEKVVECKQDPHRVFK